MNLILCIVYLLFTISGVVFMKLGGDSVHLSLSPSFSISMGWLSFLGFSCYLISFLLWRRLLISNDISIIIPVLTGVVQIITCIAAFMIFKESFNIYKILGIVLIIIGIILLTIKGIK